MKKRTPKARLEGLSEESRKLLRKGADRGFLRVEEVDSLASSGKLADGELEVFLDIFYKFAVEQPIEVHSMSFSYNST